MEGSRILEMELAIGRPLTISAKTARGRVRLKAKVSYLGRHHFKVRLDKSLRKKVLINGQEINIRLLGDKKSLPLDSRYLRGNDVETIELVLAIPGGEWITNRRNFVRVSMELLVVLTRRSDEKIQGKTLNISGGGLLAVFDKRLMLGEDVTVAIEIPDRPGEEVTFLGKVVRQIEYLNKDNVFGIQFKRVERRAQNKVCKMVIVRQFEDRRAELKLLTSRSEF